MQYMCLSIFASKICTANPDSKLWNENSIKIFKNILRYYILGASGTYYNQTFQNSEKLIRKNIGQFVKAFLV